MRQVPYVGLVHDKAAFIFSFPENGELAQLLQLVVVNIFLDEVIPVPVKAFPDQCLLVFQGAFVFEQLGEAQCQGIDFFVEQAFIQGLAFQVHPDFIKWH